MSLGMKIMTNLSAINRALAFLLCALLWGGNAWAVTAATVTHLSGTLVVMKPDGSSRILSVKSNVESGDTISTEKDTFARIKFTDGGETVLRPNTILKLDSYAYNQDKPKEDGFFSSLLKGGARFVSGLIGKRGNRDAYAVKASTATIGIRGTEYVVLVCSGGNCPAGMKDGAYTLVFEGSVSVHNEFGEIGCGAGQFCFTPLDGAPVTLLEVPPGVDFSTPSSFLDQIGGDTVLDTQGHKECVIH